MLCLITACIGVPAYAYNFSSPVTIDYWTYEVCPYIDGYTARIVVCIKETIVTAMFNFLGPFMNYMGKTIAAVLLLATMVWGMLMVTGKNTAPMRDLALLAVKGGAVVMCTTQFDGIFSRMLDCMDYMLWAVTYFVHFSTISATCVPGSDPVMVVWQSVDCALESLIGGVMAPGTILGGLIGFLVASFFSTSVGVFIGLAGFMLSIQFILALIRAMYIFITAYIAVAVMALVSPIFIPMIMLRATKGYFEKWLKLTFGFMLQPVFLFAYLAMLLMAYDSVVYTGPVSLYRAIVGNVIDSPCYVWNGNSIQYTGAYPCFTTINDWLLGRNPIGQSVYGLASHGNLAVTLNAATATPQGLDQLQTGIMGVVGERIVQTAQNNPWLGDIYNVLGPDVFKVDIPARAINWPIIAVRAGYGTGAEAVNNYQVDLMFAVAMACIMAYIFMMLIEMLPYVGSGVSGDMLSMPALGQSGSPADKLVNSLKSKITGVATGGGGGK